MSVSDGQPNLNRPMFLTFNVLDVATGRKALFIFVSAKQVPLHTLEIMQVFTVSTWNFSPKLALKLVIPIVLGFVLLGLSATTLIALRIDNVSVHVCPHLPFILAFPTIENGSFEIP